jgi:hypothetical protein
MYKSSYSTKKNQQEPKKKTMSARKKDSVSLNVQCRHSQNPVSCVLSTADVPASAAYFGSYEIIQRWLAGPDGDRTKLAIWQTILAGESFWPDRFRQTLHSLFSLKAAWPASLTG